MLNRWIKIFPANVDSGKRLGLLLARVPRPRGDKVSLDCAFVYIQSLLAPRLQPSPDASKSKRRLYARKPPRQEYFTHCTNTIPMTS